MNKFYTLFLLNVLLMASLPLEAKYTPAPAPKHALLGQQHELSQTGKYRVQKTDLNRLHLRKANHLTKHFRENAKHSHKKDGWKTVVIMVIILAVVLPLAVIGFLIGLIISAIAGSLLGVILFGVFALLFLVLAILLFLGLKNI